MVSAVGVLADTVIDASPAAISAKVATGIVFHPVDALAFGQALQRLIALFADKKLFARVQKNAMAQEVGWAASAARYAEIYQGLAK